MLALGTGGGGLDYSECWHVHGSSWAYLLMLGWSIGLKTLPHLVGSFLILIIAILLMSGHGYHNKSVCLSCKRTWVQFWSQDSDRNEKWCFEGMHWLKVIKILLKGKLLSQCGKNREAVQLWMYAQKTSKQLFGNIVCFVTATVLCRVSSHFMSTAVVWWLQGTSDEIWYGFTQPHRVHLFWNLFVNVVISKWNRPMGCVPAISACRRSLCWEEESPFVKPLCTMVSFQLNCPWTHCFGFWRPTHTINLCKLYYMYVQPFSLRFLGDS